MPFSFADPMRVNLREPVSSRDIATLRENAGVRVVQFAEPVAPGTWPRLNREFLDARPDVEFRLFGFYSSECDLSFLGELSNLRHFAADSLMRAQNVEAVCEIPRLESLSIGIYELRSFDFLSRVTPSLIRLALGRTKSKKPDLSVLGRFKGLKELYLEGQQKNIGVLTELTALEDVTLRSISTPGLEYLTSQPDLRSIDIKLGGIRDLAALTSVSALKYLEIWQVRGLGDLSVIADLETLQYLFLQDLPRVLTLPSLKKCRLLRRVVLQNLRGLRSLAPLASAPALEEFKLMMGSNFVPEDLEPVLQNPSVQRVSAYFGSDQKNRSFEALRKERQKGAFDDSPFHYR
jgi:hypothetical protein